MLKERLVELNEDTSTTRGSSLRQAAVVVVVVVLATVSDKKGYLILSDSYGFRARGLSRHGTAVHRLDHTMSVLVEAAGHEPRFHISEKIVKQLVGRFRDRVIVRPAIVVFLLFHRLPRSTGLMHFGIHASSKCNRCTKGRLKRKRVPKPSPTPFSAPFCCSRLRGASGKLSQSKLILRRCQTLRRGKLPNYFADHCAVNYRPGTVT